MMEDYLLTGCKKLAAYIDKSSSTVGRLLQLDINGDRKESKSKDNRRVYTQSTTAESLPVNMKQ